MTGIFFFVITFGVLLVTFIAHFSLPLSVGFFIFLYSGGTRSQIRAKLPQLFHANSGIFSGYLHKSRGFADCFFQKILPLEQNLTREFDKFEFARIESGIHEFASSFVLQ
jgi:hypothetical protein